MRAAFIVLTYNQAKFVSSAIQGVLSQDCDPLDILISDDASDDGTFEMICECVHQYKGPHNVRLNCNTRNLGLSEHINWCMSILENDVIIVGAGDDVSLPHRAKRVLDAFDDRATLLVHSRVELMDREGEHLNAEYDYSSVLFFNTTHRIAAAKSMSLYIGATGAWHRKLFEKYGPITEDNVYEDLVLGFRAALEAGVKLIDEPLVRYRIGGMSSPSLSVGVELSAAHRTEILKRNLSVLRQRILDALTINSIDVLDQLRDEELATELRVQWHELSLPRYMLQNAKHLRSACKAIRSEYRAMRKQC